MKPRLPVTVIGGYLGSGKTTLINHLLRHANGVRLAVLVNDFGELPIDADLIEADDGDVISLSGGCICCSYGDDLTLSLQQLRKQKSLPDHVFIETSGVALPGSVGQSLSLQPAYLLEGIVVLADASTVQYAAAEKYIGDTLRRQLSDADLIILNKLDLLSERQVKSVRRWMCEHYAHAPLIESEFSTISPDVLLGSDKKLTSRTPTASGFSRGSKDGDDRLESQQSDHHASSVFSSINLTIEHVVDAYVLAPRLADKRCGLVRAKGFVMNNDNTLKTIQVVGRRWSVTDAPTNVKPGLVCIANTATLSEATVRSFCELDNSDLSLE